MIFYSPEKPNFLACDSSKKGGATATQNGFASSNFGKKNKGE
jgi:hypothetical protein